MWRLDNNENNRNFGKECDPKKCDPFQSLHFDYFEEHQIKALWTATTAELRKIVNLYTFYLVYMFGVVYGTMYAIIHSRWFSSPWREIFWLLVLRVAWICRTRVSLCTTWQSRVCRHPGWSCMSNQHSHPLECAQEFEPQGWTDCRSLKKRENAHLYQP